MAIHLWETQKERDSSHHHFRFWSTRRGCRGEIHLIETENDFRIEILRDDKGVRTMVTSLSPSKKKTKRKSLKPIAYRQ